MKITHNPTLTIETKDYTLSVKDPKTVRILVKGILFADLRVTSGISGADGTEDIAENLTGPEVQDIGGGLVRLVWTSSSSRWVRKTYTFECTNDLVGYRMEVEGEGDIGAVEFFDGKDTLNGPASMFHFGTVFSPEVSLLDRRYYRSWEYACIDATAGETREDYPFAPFETNHWIFTPPPFVFCWGATDKVALNLSDRTWLGVGLAPDPGQYNFNYYQYWPIHNHFKLRATYDGMTYVDGFWLSPRIVFIPGKSEYSSVKDYCNYLYNQQLAVKPKRVQPEWWSRPMFCGWGEQNATAMRHPERPSGQNFARQDVYDKFLELLEERKLNPGVLVIDDKWQKHYALMDADEEKWPDLRGWIDRQHAIGRRVLLWWGCWNRDGAPDDECLTKDGEAVCLDPSNPKYEQRLKEAIRRMLSDEPGCYNADGFKVDWTNGFPVGPGYHTYSGSWGVELLKKYYEIIHVNSKIIKDDALIVTHAANPYFADVTDMLRLNDIHAVNRDLPDMMGHRQKIALAANPDWLIDCDNSTAPTVEEWLRYTVMQPQFGVPSLYFLTGVDGSEEDIPIKLFDQLPDIWRQKW